MKKNHPCQTARCEVNENWERKTGSIVILTESCFPMLPAPLSLPPLPRSSFPPAAAPESLNLTLAALRTPPLPLPPLLPPILYTNSSMVVTLGPPAPAGDDDPLSSFLGTLGSSPSSQSLSPDPSAHSRSISERRPAPWVILWGGGARKYSRFGCHFVKK